MEKAYTGAHGASTANGNGIAAGVHNAARRPFGENWELLGSPRTTFWELIQMGKGNIESGDSSSGNSAAGSHEPFFLKHGGVDARLWWQDKQHWWYFI